MRFKMILVLLLMLWTGSAFGAQTGFIGLYIDPAATDNTFDDTGTTLMKMYVVIMVAQSTQAVQFSAPIPDCFEGALYLSDEPVSPFITMGNSQSSVSVGFGECLSSPVHVLTINVLAQGLTDTCCAYPVLAGDSPSGEIEFVDCDNNIIYGYSSIALVSDGSYPRIVNPDPSDSSADEPLDTKLSWTVERCSNDLCAPVLCIPFSDVYFGTTPDPPLVAQFLYTTTYDPGPLTPFTTYYWKIRATDTTTGSEESPVWTFTTSAFASTIYVKPDGSGDVPTIQDAINVADSSNTVLLASGTFTGVGNRDIDYLGKAITVTSESGPEVTIIDCEGLGRAFVFQNGEDGLSVLSGVTIQNGNSEDGGAIYCNGASPTITNNILRNNSAFFGGAIACSDASPIISSNIIRDNSGAGGGGIMMFGSNPNIINNLIHHNHASVAGGGIYISNECYPGISHNTLSENSSMEGGGICCHGMNDFWVHNTIIAFSSQGEGIYCGGSTWSRFVCSNVYGNAGGDDICVVNLEGNISEDPKFCGGLGSGDYSLQWSSPCAPENNSCGELMGAMPVRDGCGPAGRVQCPNDSTIAAFSTVPYLELEGFSITNMDTVVLEFFYYLTAEGPAALVNNGDSTSLMGTTPPLLPGESFSPPPAALDIPEIREYAQEVITYRVVDLSTPEFLDPCMTTITFYPPVAILIDKFEGKAVAGGVELVWEITSNEKIKGFKVYRRLDNGGEHVLVNPNGLISPEKRKYLDNDIQRGRTYNYILNLVREDNSEVQSQTITVRFKAQALVLHQNYPNPFNPITTISFTLPERAHTQLSIFNLEGKLVKTLISETLNEGYKEVTWDGTDNYGNPVSSGIYFYRLKAGGQALTRKLALIR